MEREIFARTPPWGFILFGRNVVEPAQVKALCDDLRRAVDRPDAPILIDQEGGTVARLRPPHWPAYPSAAALGGLDAPLALRAALTASAFGLIATDLRALGVNVNCAPVLDVRRLGGDPIVGDRSFSADPREAAVLGQAAADALIAGGVVPVVKHIPGHGAASGDSHWLQPHVTANLAELEALDFHPFKQLNGCPAAMTAHVVFDAIDPDRPATVSRQVIGEAIRGRIGFDGLLMTDDLTMEALSGSALERATAALDAGCDVVLLCQGAPEEKAALLEALPNLSGPAARRASRCLELTAAPSDAFDPVTARARLIEAGLLQVAA